MKLYYNLYPVPSRCFVSGCWHLLVLLLLIIVFEGNSITLYLGVVQTTAMLDYETSSSHNLTIRARDPFTGGHTDTHVTITVTDVNDNPPQFTYSIFKGDVSEAASPGHVVLQVSYMS